MEYLIPEDTAVFFDLESTLLRLEGLNKLANIVLKNDFERLSRIVQTTHMGQSGEIDFTQSLSLRMGILVEAGLNYHHIADLKQEVAGSLAASVLENSGFFQANRDSVYFLSAGFLDLLWPAINQFDLPQNHIFTNQFISKGIAITGYNRDNPLSREGGKTAVIKRLKQDGLRGKKIWMVGDGQPDFDTYRQGAAHRFILYKEVRSSNRPLEEKAIFHARRMEDVIEILSCHKRVSA